MIFSSPVNRRIARALTTLGQAYCKKYVRWNVCIAIRVTGLLCLLPLLEKFHTLPALLQRLAPARPKQQIADTFAIERAVRVVLRLCHRRPFRSALYPRACLRQSLVLYHTLTHMGFPVEFHLGVRKNGEELIGHSWVTFAGKPIADTSNTDGLKIVYSHSYESSSRIILQGG